MFVMRTIFLEREEYVFVICKSEFWIVRVIEIGMVVFFNPNSARGQISPYKLQASTLFIY